MMANMPKFELNHVMRKLAFAICEQQRHRSACASAQSDQRLCCSLPGPSIIPVLSIVKISSLYLASVAAQAGLCLTRSKTPKAGFLVTRLNYSIEVAPSAFWNLVQLEQAHLCMKYTQMIGTTDLVSWPCWCNNSDAMSSLYRHLRGG